LVERIEALERRLAALQEDFAEAQDTISRKLDKYRKRLEREDPPPDPPAAPAQALRALNGGPTRGFDELAIRRGARAFPGGGR
jgi:hypothetical protein